MRILNDPDFRNVKWGMSKKEVIQQELEGNMMLEYKGMPHYRVTVYGHPATLIYGVDDKSSLMWAQYEIKADAIQPDKLLINNDSIVKAYLSIKYRLIREFGKPMDSEVLQYTNEGNDRVVMQTIWESNNSSIKLTASNIEYGIRVFFEPKMRIEGPMW